MSSGMEAESLSLVVGGEGGRGHTVRPQWGGALPRAPAVAGALPVYWPGQAHVGLVSSMPFPYHSKSQWSGNGILLPEMLYGLLAVVTNDYKLGDLKPHIYYRRVLEVRRLTCAARDPTLPQAPGGISSWPFSVSGGSARPGSWPHLAASASVITPLPLPLPLPPSSPTFPGPGDYTGPPHQHSPG